MDISSYDIQEPLWIEFLENTFTCVTQPIIGNKFEDVSNLFSKYFKKNNKDNKHNKQKIIKDKICKKRNIPNLTLYNTIEQKAYRLKKKHNFLQTLKTKDEFDNYYSYLKGKRFNSIFNEWCIVHNIV
jgi:N-glycosylase/DNA lyase